MKEQDTLQKQKCTNMDYLKRLTKGNPKMIMEMVKIYLDETPKFLDKLKQGLNNMDWESMARAAHSLKPSFATMGMGAEFTEMAKNIQEYAEKKENPEKIKEWVLKIEAACSQAREE